MQKKDKVLVRINIAQSSYEANAFPCLAVLHHPKTQMKEGRFPHSITRPSMILCVNAPGLDIVLQNSCHSHLEKCYKFCVLFFILQLEG